MNDKIEINYVDDDIDDIEIFTTAINSLKNQIPIEVKLLTYTNTNFFLERIRVNKPGSKLVFLDINMPGRSGMEVLDIIKKDEHLKHTKVIMFSTGSTEGSINACELMGADHYIVKPGNFNILCEILARTIDDHIAGKKGEFIITV